jgi:hypothetical protein
MARDVETAMRRYFEAALVYRVESLVGLLRDLERDALDGSARLTNAERDIVLNRLEDVRRMLAGEASSSP